MFNLFKSNEDNSAKDVKTTRDLLLRFIKEQLQKAEGGEGRNIKGIHLFFTDNSDKHVYESAVYLDEPDRFKEEIQKIADDFALGLPSNWQLEVTFQDEPPPEAIKVPSLKAAIFIRTKDHSIRKSATACITILSGEAEQQEYQVSSSQNKYNIGRERKAQVEGGFFRTNHIAFPADCSNDCNKYVSRQHAHIEWNNENGYFMLFADEGGIPPHNKVKIKPAEGDNLIKLHSSVIGHRLQEGDQIILGESAVLEFSYKPQ